MTYDMEGALRKQLENNNKKAEILKEKFPSIKFPSEFIVTKDDPNPHFMVRKDGAPNEVSVIVFTGDVSTDNRPPEWEILAQGPNHRLMGDSLQHVDIDDTEGLIKAIEQSLYYEEAEIKTISNHDDEELNDDE